MSARLGCVVLLACGGGGGTPDASLVDAGDAPHDALVDAPAETDAGGAATTFAWDPWPSGPVDYVITHPRCNHGGGDAGECPAGYACGPAIDVPFVALTRREPVCEPTAEHDPFAPIPLRAPTPAAPETPREVVVRVHALDAAEGTMRVRDALGREVYAGPAGPSTTLQLDPGPHALTLALPRTDAHPPWTRSGVLAVGAPGEVLLPLAQVRWTLRSELPRDATLRLRNQTTGAVEVLALAAGEARTLPLVPGAHTALVITDAGSFELEPFEVVEAGAEGESTVARALARVEGRVALDAGSARGTLRFVGAAGDPVDVRLSDGAFTAALLVGDYDVYLDTLREPVAPQSRAWLGRFAIEADRTLELAARVVRFTGEVTVEGAPAPGGPEGRLGFLQLEDPLGIASRAVDVRPGGRFEGTLLATTADLRFTGARDPLPRLAQRVAERATIEEGEATFDVSARVLRVGLTTDGARLPDGPAELEAPRGRVVVSDGTREVAVAVPRSGVSEVLVHVPAGDFEVFYEASGSPFLPEARTQLGAVEVDALEARLDADVRIVDVRFSLAAGVVAERLRFRAFGDVARTDVAPAAGRVLLFGGTYDVRTVCLGGCGELLHGWLRF